MEKLTATQSKALTFIRSVTHKNGAPPTLRELCEFMGYSAIGSAQDLVNALRRKGYLESPEKQVARSLTVTREALRDPALESTPETLVVPCLGAVPAGNPLEAVEERVGTLRMSTSMFGKNIPSPREVFALRASGNSMVDAGILDGDWLVVRSCKNAPAGTIVVARTESGDATVKRLMRDKARGWYLKPENAGFKPIYAGEKPFEVIGQVVALQRQMM
jgi:repressor LexA